MSDDLSLKVQPPTYYVNIEVVKKRWGEDGNRPGQEFNHYPCFPEHQPASFWVIMVMHN